MFLRICEKLSFKNAQLKLSSINLAAFGAIQELATFQILSKNLFQNVQRFGFFEANQVESVIIQEDFE